MTAKLTEATKEYFSLAIIEQRYCFIEGFSKDYIIGENGDIYSLKIKATLKKLTTEFDHKEGWVAYLCKNGRTTNYPVHRLLYHHFIAPIKKNYYVIHKNGDARDNSLSNLEAKSATAIIVSRTGVELHTSQFKGVSYDSCKRNRGIKRWITQCQKKWPDGRETRYRQRWEHEIDAAKDYNHIALKWHGEGCFLNELPDEDL